MSDPAGAGGAPGITVTAPLPGGGVAVASDVLLTQLDSLNHLAEILHRSAGEVTSLLDGGDVRASAGVQLPPAAIDARRVTSSALHALLVAADHAAGLAAAVRSALGRYEQADEVIRNASHSLDEAVAELIGAEFTLLGLPLTLAGAAGVAGVLAGARVMGLSPKAVGGMLQSFLEHHGRILTNPGTVALIRELTSDADGFGEGVLLVPPPVALLWQKTGKSGVSSSANSVVGLGRTAGLFEPTGVSVQKTSSFANGTPPTSLATRASSFPNSRADPNGEQIRIDRYVEPGKPDRFDVYVGGTVTFDPKTTTEPFDLQSDLAGVGQQPTASCQAVVDAMRQAGVTSQTPVVLNGYSQGGLVVSTVAASGHYNVHGVVTFGAPSGQVHLPASVPVLTVRNSEDLVPATSGYDVNPHAVVVTRDAFAHEPIPSDVVVPAHQLSVYQQTAAVVDGSASSEVRGVLDPLNRFGDGATRVDSTLWKATRTSP